MTGGITTLDTWHLEDLDAALLLPTQQVSVAGNRSDVWLQGAPAAVRCGGTWYSADAADIAVGVAPLRLINASVVAGRDPRLGPTSTLVINYAAGGEPFSGRSAIARVVFFDRL